MKKVLLLTLTTLVLLWSCGSAFAQDTNRAGEQTKKLKKPHKGPKPSTYAERRKASEQRRLQKRRQERRKMRELRRKTIEKFKHFSVPNQPGAKTKEAKNPRQQMETLRTQITHERAKHLWRLARLKRIRELATEEKNKDIIKRVDDLQRKEQLRYEQKEQILKMRRRILMRQKASRKYKPAYNRNMGKRLRKGKTAGR